MPDQLQLRGGTTTEHNTFTGASKEVTVDTTKKTAVVHDGTTAGGNPLMREDGTNSSLIAGSAGSPSLKFDGDSDTGIYSPGANQLALATNGTGRLFVDSGGNVGIGTTSPQKLIHVQSGSVSGAARGGASTKTLFESSSAALSYWEFQAASTAQSDILFSKGNTGSYGIVGYDHTNDSLRFHTNSSERARIDSSGNVGVGTSSPGSTFDCRGIGSFVGSSDGSAIQALNIQNFGISTGSAAEIVFNNSSSFNVNQFTKIGAVRRNSPNTGDTNLYFSVQSSSSSKEQLRITPTGVGIGTTSPGVELHVDGDIRCDGVYGETDTNTSIQFPGSDVITFNEGGSEAARIDSSGKLLVGTSSAIEGYQLQLEQNIGTNPYAGSILLRRDLSNNGLSANYALGTIAAGSTTNVGGLISFTADGTWGSGDYPTRLEFSTTADGASSPTERMRISSSGWVSFKAGTNTVSTPGNVYINPDGNGTNIPFIGTGGASSDNAALCYGLYSSSLAQYQFYVGYGGTVYARSTSISSLSDQREKQNIQDLDVGLSEILALQPRRFDWKDGSGQNIAGFVAQEVELVLPDLVEDYQFNESETRKSLKMGDMIPALVKAIQEQQAVIVELQAKVAALEAS